MLPAASQWLDSCWHLQRINYSQATQQHATEERGQGDPSSSAGASGSDQAASNAAPEAGHGQRPYADLSQEEVHSLLEEKDAELEAQKNEVRVQFEWQLLS